MPEILICDPVADEGLDILRRAGNVSVETGLSPQQLVERAPHFEAIMVRSQTKITRAVLEAATRLQIVGRAGVGVDNIDVEAATERGVIVVNSPAGNTVAVAELAMGMALALVRRLVPAHISTSGGEWKRSSFMGSQLYNKTLGVIGVGRIGVEVSKRAQAFGMNVLGYDPFLTSSRATQLNIEGTSIEDILRRADVVTLHTPLTAETRHLINARAISTMKDGAILLNCSRGGIVDEAALADALKSGKLGGAGLDVYEIEPPKESPLFGLPNLILTPHLGASTEEAQVEVALDVARQIVDVLGGRPPSSAVNLPPLPPEAREFILPFLPLAEKLGRLQAQLADGRIESVELNFSGGLDAYDTGALSRFFMKGLLQNAFGGSVSYVNALAIAEARGVQIKESKQSGSGDYANLISTRVARVDNGHPRVRQVDGTVFNGREPHVVAIQGLRVDVELSGTLLIVPNTDKPGMIGAVGTVLGQAGVNIAAMEVGRKAVGERAVMVISLEQPIEEEVMARLNAHPDLFGARQVDLR
jgi:D-3-phosphoglycerate dehydrogenase